ncbi:MAG: MIP/aquaporin family protein [Chitinophagaceae bacterium]|nr:MIP/aquaporin family protein [Chitinophagaceae bacterium]
MNPFISELLGTMLIIVFGCGVVANVLLKNTKGHGSGLIVICFGWAIGVFVGVFVASHGSKAHLNPAVTIALAVVNKFSWEDVPLYIIGQFLGAFIGALLVWACYKQHFDATIDSATKRDVFCNAPAMKSNFFNLITEVIATFIFMIAILFISPSVDSLGSLDALPVSLLVLGIGLSMGGPTGYAINPARDLAPRIAHSLLPFSNKADSNWNYAWIPVVAPIIGAVLAVWCYYFIVS